MGLRDKLTKNWAYRLCILTVIQAIGSLSQMIQLSRYEWTTKQPSFRSCTEAKNNTRKNKHFSNPSQYHRCHENVWCTSKETSNVNSWEQKKPLRPVHYLGFVKLFVNIQRRLRALLNSRMYGRHQPRRCPWNNSVVLCRHRFLFP